MRPTQKQNKVDGVSQIQYFVMLSSFSHHDTPMVVTITLLLFICFVLFKYIPYSVQCTVYSVYCTVYTSCCLFVETFADWEVDYVKMDGCNSDPKVNHCWTFPAQVSSQFFVKDLLWSPVCFRAL